MSAVKALNMSMGGMKVAIQGYGNAGWISARLLADQAAPSSP